jgi:ubiquitin-conjugating enzyme E2 J1
MKEQKDMLSDPSPFFYAEPLESEPFEWHFTIRGPPQTPFEGGFYHGVITLPSSYPFKPPYIVFLTPSGRFQVKEKICLTFTNYHPEHWQPAWTIRNILQALVSFMPVDEDNMSIGAITGTKEERQRLAKKSVDFVCDQCGAIEKVIKDKIPALTS